MFTVAFAGQDPFRFDVNSTHMENGAAEFTLPLSISDLVDICTLRGGRTFASNNAGESEAVDVQFPEGEIKFLVAIHECGFMMQ